MRRYAEGTSVPVEKRNPWARISRAPNGLPGLQQRQGKLVR